MEQGLEQVWNTSKMRILKGYSKEHAITQTRAIYDTTLEILKKAELDGITTHAAALVIAEKRIADRKNQ